MVSPRLAHALISAEGIIAALLVISPFPEVSLVVCAGLLAGFGVVMAVDLVGGHRHPCGCAGSNSAVTSWRLVGRNLAVASIGLALAAVPPAPFPVRLLIGAAVVSILILASSADHLAFPDSPGSRARWTIAKRWVSDRAS
ncbi:MAG: hypothetical protein H0V04_07650 [Chloroflexi bacterium]|nr:hypothetical protein [Chloroflexota bacterium]